MGSFVMKQFWLAGIISVLLWLVACDEHPKPAPIQKPSPAETKFVPLPTAQFSATSAYQFVNDQVAFGPRVPNTEAHRKCATWLEAELKSMGLLTTVQRTSVTAYNNLKLDIFNITAQYNPEATRRILLCAHWDSRPYADRDSKDQTKAIDGANDGASGVGVLLELARAISSDTLKPDIGFDIVLFDAEDYGKPESAMVGNSNNSWCLGSQYWASNIPIANYKPEYGILLDMVGAKNAVFPKEGASMHFAPQVVNKVWNLAAKLGHKAVFVPFVGNQITDDHIYLNQIAGIPTIDIIHYEVARNDFGKFHHTHEDNMSGIDSNMLGIVGEVLMQLIYSE